MIAKLDKTTDWAPSTGHGDDADRWLTSGYYCPEFQRQTIRELEALLTLAEDWDRQGASKISPQIVESAKELIRGLPENLIYVPRVVPMAKGNLQFEWHDGPKTLEFEVENNGQVCFLCWHPETNVEEEGHFAVSDSQRAEELIRWFLGSFGSAW